MLHRLAAEQTNTAETDSTANSSKRWEEHIQIFNFILEASQIISSETWRKVFWVHCVIYSYNGGGRHLKKIIRENIYLLLKNEEEKNIPKDNLSKEMILIFFPSKGQIIEYIEPIKKDFVWVF